MLWTLLLPECDTVTTPCAPGAVVFFFRGVSSGSGVLRVLSAVSLPSSSWPVFRFFSPVRSSFCQGPSHVCKAVSAGGLAWNVKMFHMLHNFFALLHLLAPCYLSSAQKYQGLFSWEGVVVVVWGVFFVCLFFLRELTISCLYSLSVRSQRVYLYT